MKLQQNSACLQPGTVQAQGYSAGYRSGSGYNAGYSSGSGYDTGYRFMLGYDSESAPGGGP